MKKQVFAKIAFFLLFVAMTIIPLVLMYKMSLNEKEDYIQNTNYVYREAAYGEIALSSRQDIEQYYTFDGYFSSSTYEYINLMANSEKDSIQTFVGVGDEVMKGDIIAKIGNYQVSSEHDGIVEEVASYLGGYIKLKTFNELELLCMAERNVVDNIKKCDTLKLEDGKKVTIKRTSNIVNDNLVMIIFKIEDGDYMYGEQVEKLKIYTGKVYNDVLVVDKDAVYKKSDGKYYVRVLDESSYFKEERQVEINFETDEYVGVLGIEEGTMCDLGYKSLIEINQGDIDDR